jgi:hypothetical protein
MDGFSQLSMNDAHLYRDPEYPLGCLHPIVILKGKQDDGTDTLEKYKNFMDGVVSASLPVKATDRVTVTPMIAYIFPLGNDAKNFMKFNSLKDSAFADKDSAFLYGGMSFSFSF